MSYILQTDHLTKQLEKKELIHDVSLHVRKGEIYGFLGPNGAGKTTIMKLIANLWKPTSGSITLFGEPLTPRSYPAFKRMGIILEFPVFYDSLSGDENLRLHCDYLGYYSPGCVEQILSLLGLAADARKPVREYSLGMKQRLGIARAILSKPELLILDEPINGLDPAGIKQIRDLLTMLNQEYGISILISSHILSEIENLAHTIGILSRGNLLQELSMQEILDQNLSYFTLTVSNLDRAAYVLAETLGLTQFQCLDAQTIRVYDTSYTAPELSKALVLHDVALESIGKHTNSLEDYYLKLTETGDASC